MCTEKEGLRGCPAQLKVDLHSERCLSHRTRARKREKRRTEDTSSLPKAIPHVGHLRCRFESRASMQSLQKRWPQRLIMTPLKRKLQVEHLSIFCLSPSAKAPRAPKVGRTHRQVVVVLLELPHF